MQISNAVILIDTKGVLSSSDAESLDRHLNYALELNSVVPGSKFYVFSTSKSNLNNVNNASYEQFFIKSNKYFSPLYIWKTFRRIRSLNLTNIVLVSGNPWETALCLRIIDSLIRIKSSVNVKTQIQVHGEIFDYNINNSGIVDKIRHLIFSNNLNSATNIRVVNEKQKNFLVKNYKIKPQTITIIPVMLNFNYTKSQIFSENRPISIGFAGRFHKERRIDSLFRYIIKLNSVQNEFNVVLAGAGNDLERYLDLIEREIGSKRLIYCGNLTSNSMINFWSKVGVYVSTAESESFGRAIREAACFGIPILGIKSNGFDDLYSYNFPWIQYLDLEARPIDLHIQFMELQNTITNDAIRSKLMRNSETNKSKLIQSWSLMLKN